MKAGEVGGTEINPERACRGYLGPGGIQDNGQFKNCVGGATGYLDRMVLGDNHIFRHPTAREVYGSGPFDPEGIVGKMSVVEELGRPVDTDRSPMDTGVGVT
jgi:hypothetical protein